MSATAELPAAGAPIDTPGIAAHDCWKPKQCGALGVTTRRPVTMLTRDSSKEQMARHIRDGYLTSIAYICMQIRIRGLRGP